MRKKIKKGKLSEIFKRFKIENISLSTDAAGIEISYTNWDAEAAWLMYVELLTRITTQPLTKNFGDEATALESIHNLFQITRDILKNYGRNAASFTKIAIIILNQKVRPFTSKWHKLSAEKAFDYPKKCEIFRKELELLRHDLISYTKILAEMANVEDLTYISFEYEVNQSRSTIE